MTDGTSAGAGRPAGDASASGGATDPRVDAVLADLEQLGELPVEEHLAVYERVHAKLREVLQTAGQEQRGPRPPQSQGTPQDPTTSPGAP